MKLGKSVRYIVRNSSENMVVEAVLKVVENSIHSQVWHSVGNPVWRATEFPMKLLWRKLEDRWD